MTIQLSDCCKATIDLDKTKERPECYTCSKCGRIIGSPFPPKTNEYITLYDLRGPWAEESAKKIILQRINTKIDTIIKEKDKEREEAVAEARREFKSLEASWMALKDDYSEICRALGFKGDSWFGDPLVDHAEIIAKAKALSHQLEIY